MKKFVLLYYIILQTLPLLVRAAEYTLIAPIPGKEGAKTATSFATYLQALFPFLLSVAAVLAFVMIVLGGIFYMTSAGNPAAVSSAKDRIKAALIGLLIAVSSYLIINAINPNLLNLDFSGSITPIPSSSGGGGSGGGGGGSGGGGGETQAIAQKIQSENADDFSTNGDCSGVNGKVYALTNLNEAAAGAPTSVCQSGCGSQPTASLCGPNAGVKLNARMVAQIDILLNDSKFKNQTTIESLATGDHRSGSLHYTGNAVDITKKSGAAVSYQEIKDFVGSLGGNTAICDSGGNNVPCSQANHVHVGY